MLGLAFVNVDIILVPEGRCQEVGMPGKCLPNEIPERMVSPPQVLINQSVFRTPSLLTNRLALYHQSVELIARMMERKSQFYSSMVDASAGLGITPSSAATNTAIFVTGWPRQECTWP